LFQQDHDTQFDMAQAIQDVIAKTTRYMDDYYEFIRRASEEQCNIINQITRSWLKPKTTSKD